MQTTDLLTTNHLVQTVLLPAACKLALRDQLGSTSMAGQAALPKRLPSNALQVISFGLNGAVAQRVEAQLGSLGIDALCKVVSTSPEGLEAVKSALGSKSWNGVMLGPGITEDPQLLPLFNCLVNLIHQHAPQAKFIFPSSPEDVQTSITRELGVPL